MPIGEKKKKILRPQNPLSQGNLSFPVMQQPYLILFLFWMLLVGHSLSNRSVWSPKAKPAPFGSQYILLKAVRAWEVQTLRGLQEKLNVASVSRDFWQCREGEDWKALEIWISWSCFHSNGRDFQKGHSYEWHLSTVSFPRTGVVMTNQELQAKQNQGVLAIFWPLPDCCIPVDEDTIMG